MFTAEQKARLKALLAMDASKLSDADKKELSDLQTAAKAANYDPAQDVEPMTDDALKKLIEDAFETKGLKSETLIEEIKKAIPAAATAEKIQEIVTKAVADKGADAKAIADAVVKAIPATATADQIGEAMTKALKDWRPPSRMEHQNGHDGNVIEMPIAHRKGNLSVAQKQLLNICMSKVSDDAIARTVERCPGYKRPTGINDGITDEQLRVAAANGERRVKSLENEMRQGYKAITSTGAGSGLELMNVEISSDLLMRLYMASQLSAAMVASEIDMPTNPFKLPMTTTRPTFYVGQEGVQATTSTPGTQQPTFDAVKFIGQVDYSYEADEDAVVAILPALQNLLGSSAADALEGAIINGDYQVNGSHQDSDINAIANHASKAFNGFRYLAIAGNLNISIATGGVSAANIKVLRKALIKYGIRPQDLLIVCGPSGYNELIALPETLSAYQTGSPGTARIMTGTAPSIYGIDIVPSSQCREDLNPNGVYDGATTGYGSLYIIHKPSWMMGKRRGFTIEVFVDPRIQMNNVIASFRRHMLPNETPSVQQAIVAFGYGYRA